jgi:hypothetical protein
MAQNVGVPRMPVPPSVWNAGFMRDFIRVLEDWMRRISSESNREAAALAFVETDVDLSLGPADGFCLASTDISNITITLPAANTVFGREFTVKRKTSGRTLTIDTVSGEIDESASTTINSRYDSLRFKSDGTDYWTF